MKTTFRLLPLAAGLALAGCAHEVQVTLVDPAKKCAMAPTLLQACDAPRPLPADVTYRDLIVSYQGDRDSLRRCGAQREDLANALEACNEEIDRHNADLAAKVKQAQ